ncbi:amidohydrolase [Kordiimonas pumila]|uniref:Amidohydrolase n=1 Tax=Kordiimonas pumila TaxID=2161677 RepID=A0ABV7D295_9PROT|nr:amidohydrolase [Kordiimonas pumila]
MKGLVIGLIGGLCLSGTVAAETSISKDIDADYDYLENLYKHLHQTPELSFKEDKTSVRMAEELRNAGYTVTEKVGGYGVVGVLKNGEGPTILVRTDMDALPVDEKTGVPYSSTVKTIDDVGKTVSVMHACGHDMHMTVFTGTARLLAAKKDKWKGTLVLIAQPAEERGSGARAMLSDSLYERFPRPDYALGLHVSAGLPAGVIGYTPGYAMANVDTVDITLFGIGGHGAAPHTTKDPVVLAAQVVTSLQTLVSRELNPTDPGVVTVGSIHGGTKHNIISGQVDLQLTVRSYSDKARETLLRGIERIAKGQAVSMGLPEDKMPIVKISKERTPAVYNTPEVTAGVIAMLEGELGEQHLLKIDPVMAGEDFSEYGRVEPAIPSVFMWLGAVAPDTYDKAQKSGAALPSLHSAYFAPMPKPTIKTGVETLTDSALYLFNK